MMLVSPSLRTPVPGARARPPGVIDTSPPFSDRAGHLAPPSQLARHLYAHCAGALRAFTGNRHRAGIAARGEDTRSAACSRHIGSATLQDRAAGRSFLQGGGGRTAERSSASLSWPRACADWRARLRFYLRDARLNPGDMEKTEIPGADDSRRSPPVSASPFGRRPRRTFFDAPPGGAPFGKSSTSHHSPPRRARGSDTRERVRAPPGARDRRVAPLRSIRALIPRLRTSKQG